MGFGVPLDHWFRHDLREMTHDLLLGEPARPRHLPPDAVSERRQHEQAEFDHATVSGPCCLPGAAGSAMARFSYIRPDRRRTGKITRAESAPGCLCRAARTRARNVLEHWRWFWPAGKDRRLEPLTRDRAKPAVPFGGAYRIIDFTLSNCLNSGIRKMLVLTQYKAMSLDRHINLGWQRFFCRELGEFIDVVPPQQRIDEHWYQGTADAVYQNIYTIEKERPEYVVILAGDHIYKMNYGTMVEYHIADGRRPDHRRPARAAEAERGSSA